MSAQIEPGMIMECVRAPDGCGLTVGSIYQCEDLCTCADVILRALLKQGCYYCGEVQSIRIKGKDKWCYCPCMFKPFSGDGVKLEDEEEIDQGSDDLVGDKVLEDA